MHTPHGDARYRLPWTFSTFDYRELCQLLWRDCDATFETAKVNGRAAPANGGGEIAVDTDRGVISAPLVVDALGWRRMLASGDGYQPPDAPLSRGLEVHPARRRRGPRDLDRPPLRARRLRLVVPGPRRAADRDRLLRPPLPRQGDDRAAGRGPRQATAYATRATGSRTSCAAPPRAASSSPATRPATACRSAPRGSEPRSTSASPSAASCAASSRGGRAASRRPRPTPSSTTRTSGSSAGCCGCSG